MKFDVFYCGMFEVWFTNKDPMKLYEAVYKLNKDMIEGLELYVSVADIIREAYGTCKISEMEKWGWNINRTGLIIIELIPCTLLGNAVYELNFVNKPIKNFHLLH